MANASSLPPSLALRTMQLSQSVQDRRTGACSMASERLQRQIERLLDEANETIAKEDWPAVVSRARAVLRIDPENSDALSYLSMAERDSDFAAAPLTSRVTPRSLREVVYTPEWLAAIETGLVQLRLQDRS